jgi:hypothetical protein
MAAEITLKMGLSDSISIKPSRVIGPLAIHRQVVYVPAREEWKQTSKWQLTHIPSGRALLLPSECTDRMSDLLLLVTALEDKVGLETMESVALIKETVALIDEVVSEWRTTTEAEVSVEKETVINYVTRRSKGVGYEVIDLRTGKVVESFYHRGLAAQAAKDLNEREE